MRYSVLDGIRGITLISMILYHLLWDLVYLFNVNIEWYRSTAGFLWQQSICCVFILLSGFCWSLGRKKAKRGCIVFLAGLGITIVTSVFMPQQRVIFGVLTLLGSSMLLLIPLEKPLSKVPPFAGLLVSFLIFCLIRTISSGYLGVTGLWTYRLPDSLYRNMATAYLGFPNASFYSADYFPLLPWFFLFLTGYFLFRIADKKDWLHFFSPSVARPLEYIGRHSLPIYILHQPLLYLALAFLFSL